ncbi:MAG: hypothetical protein M1840_000699 [Geoglossum simile]|nr:MAG: hypothetical protein M1840_000699 [Geoglossum simile]
MIDSEVELSISDIVFAPGNSIGGIQTKQYRLGEDAFAKRLFLIYGDQKTVQRLCTIKKRREDAISRYDSFKWLIPIPALFHLKMNYLKMIITAHYGTEDGATDQSSLRHSKEFWNRRKVRLGNADFFALEEFVVHNYQARFVAALWRHFRFGVGGDSQESIENQIRQQDLKSLYNLIDFLRLRFIDTPSHQCTDHELRNHILFFQHAETYLLLKYAIKHVDIGLISYAFETDRLVELHNGKMKDILRTWHTSSITLDYLFEYCSLNSSFLKDLQRHVERIFGVHVNSKHSTKSSQYDIITLAAELQKYSMKFHSGRKAIRKFNARESDAGDPAAMAEEEVDTEEPIDSFYQFNEDTVSVLDFP